MFSGDFLIVGEAADFCHIYDCHSDFTTYQDINFFGEVAGVDISADDSKLFIGVTDNVYGKMALSLILISRPPMPNL